MFSKEWTSEERLKIVALIASRLQVDIPAGRYSSRENCQSIIEVVHASTEDLEQARDSIEQMVLEEIPPAEVEAFVAMPLEDARKLDFNSEVEPGAGYLKTTAEVEKASRQAGHVADSVGGTLRRIAMGAGALPLARIFGTLVAAAHEALHDRAELSDFLTLARAAFDKAKTAHADCDN